MGDALLTQGARQSWTVTSTGVDMMASYCFCMACELRMASMFLNARREKKEYSSTCVNDMKFSSQCPQVRPCWRTATPAYMWSASASDSTAELSCCGIRDWSGRAEDTDPQSGCVQKNDACVSPGARACRGWEKTLTLRHTIGEHERA